MPEYIAREDAIRIVENQSHVNTLCELRKLPAADVAEVVKCKDCRWWNRKYTAVGECEKLADRDQEGGAQFDCDTEDDDFCSYGERKENT